MTVANYFVWSTEGTSNPSQPLSELGLLSYAVLGPEPMHDLKGHLINLLTELPHILSGKCKNVTSELLVDVGLPLSKRIMLYISNGLESI